MWFTKRDAQANIRIFSKLQTLSVCGKTPFEVIKILQTQFVAAAVTELLSIPREIQKAQTYLGRLVQLPNLRHKTVMSHIMS